MGQVELEDAILAGIVGTFPGITVTPKRDISGRVVFLLGGDADLAIEAVYANKPVGALQVLQGVKSARQAIFSLKGRGNGYGYNGNR